MAYQVKFRASSLPSDRPWRPRAQDSQEAQLTFAFSPKLSALCAEFAERCQVSEDTVLKAALHALVLRYEGRVGEAPSYTFSTLLVCDGSTDKSENHCFEIGFENSTELRTDLVLSLANNPSGRITGAWRYRRDLFDRETVVRLDRHYCNLLTALIASPDQPISELSFLSGEELERVATVWNETRTDYPRNSTIPELFEQIAREYSERVAVTEGNEQLTYAELDEQSNQLARRLTEQGVTTGARVGLAFDRSISMVIAMLGILKSGAAYVPLDSSYPAERLRFMISDTDLSAIVADPKLGEKLSCSVPIISLEEVSDSEKAGANTAAGVTAESTAYIMYTSGSTGIPKGVEVTHRGVIRLVRNATYVDFGPDEVFGQVSNSSFDAITFEVWGALLNGGRLVIIPTSVLLSPETFAAAIQQHGLTAMFLTSSLFNLVASKCPNAFHSMHHLLVGGDAVDPRWSRHILETAPPRRLINGYGPTECTTFSVTHEIREVPADATTVPIGRPLSNSQAYVLDWQMQPAPAGVPGELYLGGDGLAKGYWKRPEITAERFVKSPFDPTGRSRLYKTGDLARYRKDGVIECLGRTDHQVKVRGFRIELGEIETALRKHPRVNDCVVAVAANPDGAKSLVAYVAAGNSAGLDVPSIRQFLKQHLPEYMLPSRFLFLEALPFSANGKVDRRKLAQLDSQPAETKSTPIPMTEAQQIVASTWRSVLGLTSVGLDDNFFDVGGDSLRMAALECDLKAHFDRPFTITDLFEYSTVRTMAVKLTETTTERSLVAEAQERARRRKEAGRGLRAIARGA